MLGTARRLWPACLLAFAAAAVALPPVGVAVQKPAFKDADEAASFLQSGVPTADQLRRIAVRAAELGRDEFEIREAAYRDLRALGPVCLTPLAKAFDSADPEVQRQVLRLRESLRADEFRSRQFAALEYVERLRNPKSAPVEPLFALHEFQEGDSAIADRIREVLLKVLPDAPGGLERLRRQCGHAKPRSRILAVELLAGAFPKELKALEPLAADPVAEVRFHALLALAKGGDRSRIAPLIGLFEALPYDTALVLEDLLCQLHAGEKFPAALTADTPPARAKSRDAWLEWWNKGGADVPLARLTDEPVLKGLTLIAEVDGPTQRVWEADREGKQTWEIKNCGGPVDVQPLRNGNVLIGEYYTSQVTERTRAGEIVWTAKMPGNTTSALRLPGGNTLATTHQEVVEFDRKGARVGTFPKFEGSVHQVLRDKRGRTFVLTSAGIVELDAANAIARTVPLVNVNGWGGFDLLPNGHFLIACYAGANGFFEIDGAGKQVWAARNTGYQATRVQKLRNGNVLVAGGNLHEVGEFDANQKVVWKVATQGRPFAVRRY